MTDAVWVLPFAAVLLYAAVKDWKTHQIPDRVHVLLLAVGVLRVALTPYRMWTAAAGLLIGGLPLLIAAMLAKGIGGGDVKLMGAMGFVLGGWRALAALETGLLLAVIGGLLLCGGRKKTAPIPCAPFFAAAGMVCCLIGMSPR